MPEVPALSLPGPRAPRAVGWSASVRVQDGIRLMLTMEVATVTDREHERPASEPGWMPEGSGWDWIKDEYPDGIRLMFVRGVPPERVIEAFRANPAAARLLSAEATDEIVGYPWVRVGRTGEWAFAIDSWYEERERIASQLSAGTELALFEPNPKLDYFYYFVDGREVTSFEPLLAHDRDGSDPDRFVPQMRRAGLRVDTPSHDAYLSRDPAIAVLEMLTLALGIRLSREVAMGPLLTVQPGSA
jgi:Family of unknown function (DUF6461)